MNARDWTLPGFGDFSPPSYTYADEDNQYIEQSQSKLAEVQTLCEDMGELIGQQSSDAALFQAKVARAIKLLESFQ